MLDLKKKKVNVFVQETLTISRHQFPVLADCFQRLIHEQHFEKIKATSGYFMFLT